MHRRDLFNTATAVTITAASMLQTTPARSADGSAPSQTMIDTNVSLFQWPFRRLPLDSLDTLLTKLRSLGITEAWAGSHEGIFHRDIRGVNERLAAACKQHPELVPIGSVNPELPNWEDDLQRCIEQHDMPGVRLHPNYHDYTLSDPRFKQLLKRCAGAGCFVQIVVAMEDKRMQHPMLQMPDVDLRPLPDSMQQSGTSQSRVQLLNGRPRGALLTQLAKTQGVFFDMSRVDGTDSIAKLLRGMPQDRVMFGTHAPFLIPEAALIRVHESDLRDDEIRSLMSATAQSFRKSRKGSI